MADNILVMEHITKEFPGVKALDNVNLEVQRGEIHALIGENGAGKSTLMNVLSGQYPYGSYTGTVTYEGEECKFKKLNDSEAKGIVIIHQELALIPLLSIGENMFLGNEIKNKRGAIDWDKTYSEAEKHMAFSKGSPSFSYMANKKAGSINKHIPVAALLEPINPLARK